MEECAGDATALAAAVRGGRLRAVEAMSAALFAVGERDALGAVSFLDAEGGRARAEAFDRVFSRDPKAVQSMPFAGVPFLAKDLGGPFAGLPVRAGSAALASHADPMADSALAGRFRGAGVIPFGLTTVPEFGLSLASEPASGKPARNPLDPTRTAGGSSGGAAAAVASGVVALAHATDAGGSIRVPAACCGLVGLKPTRGAVPQGPGFGNHFGGLAGELVVARSVRDVSGALDAVAGAAEGTVPDPVLAAVGSVRGLRVALVADFGDGFPLDPRRRDAVLAAARFLEGQGCRVEPLLFERLAPLAEPAQLAFDRIVSANLTQLFALLAIGDEEVEPLSAAVARRGRELSAVELWEAEHAAVRAAYAMWLVFRDWDAVLCPMLATAPPLLGSFPTDHDDVDAHWRRMAAFAPLAVLVNAAGTPALTLPFGADEDGLPTPVQLIGPMGSDRRLLALADRLARERPFAHRFPVVGLAANTGMAEAVF